MKHLFSNLKKMVRKLRTFTITYPFTTWSRLTSRTTPTGIPLEFKNDALIYKSCRALKHAKLCDAELIFKKVSQQIIYIVSILSSHGIILTPIISTRNEVSRTFTTSFFSQKTLYPFLWKDIQRLPNFRQGKVNDFSWKKKGVDL